MLKFTPLLFVAALLSGCMSSTTQSMAPKTTPPAPMMPMAQPAAAPKVASSGGISPHQTISTVVGDRRTGSRVTITYGRPLSRDPKTGEIRKIWGTLVPWDKAWRLGSDEATTIISEQPIDIGGVTLQGAVAYTLYMVPSENGPSKLAISTRIGKWGIPVDETKDLGRVDLQKSSLAPQIDELTLAIENVPAGGGLLKIMWETTQYSVAFAVKK